jgi:hypothetical protein
LKGKCLALENKMKTTIEKLNRASEEERKRHTEEIIDLKETHAKELED